ncbi:MAG: DUF1735 domain-containing protein [Haliscomenobacter sp.]|uniref:BT_3044 domain-containing protein n=1 Tax=Haliscomenobacter sp. TaxID=2717303 RepID=UPI0029B3674D|nr:DUF4361 domain-containing protein [Haliscomenobacter sp.]MDX2069108.1 DUF1735 domain-containing protein [Haliscomenobacter sp.]
MKIFKYIPLMLLGGALSFLGCEDEVVNPIEGKGDNFVRISEAANDLTLVGFDVVPGVKSVRLLDLLRDANSESSLASSVGIKMKIDKAALDAFNKAHPDDAMEELPASLYTTDPLEFSLGAGEFAKPINIKLDPTKLDLTKRYGIAVSLVDASGHKVRNGLGTAVFNIVAKNAWDGRYQATGIFAHPTAGERVIDRVKDFVTVGPTSVSGELGDLGGAGYFMVLTVNPDNSVTIAPSGVTPALKTDYQPNYYDPATKTFFLKYSYNTSAPRIVTEQIKLK